MEQVYAGHSSYVSSVCVIPADGTHSEGLVATGSRDTTILVYPSRSAEPVYTLTGHSDTGQLVYPVLFYLFPDEVILYRY